MHIIEAVRWKSSGGEKKTRGDHVKKIFSSILIAVLCTSVPAITATAKKKDYTSIQVDKTVVQNAQQLVKRSHLVVYGWSDTAYDEYPTPIKEGNGRIVNFVQKYHVKQVLKGKAPILVNLLSEGVEPLPDKSSPLNNRYPGPLAEGDYICFLQQIPGTNLYSLVGLWQGVYPIYEGKTVALGEFSFPQFQNLTIASMKQKIKELDGNN